VLLMKGLNMINWQKVDQWARLVVIASIGFILWLIYPSSPQIEASSSTSRFVISAIGYGVYTIKDQETGREYLMSAQHRTILEICMKDFQKTKER